jgi:hypothetical protein
VGSGYSVGRWGVNQHSGRESRAVVTEKLDVGIMGVSSFHPLISTYSSSVNSLHSSVNSLQYQLHFKAPDPGRTLNPPMRR